MGQAVDLGLTVARSRSAIQRIGDAMFNTIAPRVNQYKEEIGVNMYPGIQGLAEEGSFFVAGSAAIQGAGVVTIQPGTGLATIAAPTVFADGSPFLSIRNNNPPPAGSQPSIRIILDYIKLMTTAPGTNGTSVRWLSALDGPNSARTATGGSQLVPVNVNADDPNLSNAQIFAGALVAGARMANPKPPFGNILLKNAIGAAGDHWQIKFASPDGQNTLPGAVGVTLHPPVILGPGEIYTGHLIIPAQTVASSYEIEVGYIER